MKNILYNVNKKFAPISYPVHKNEWSKKIVVTKDMGISLF